MDDSSHVQRRSTLTTTFLFVAFMLVLYVLGIGPMSVLHDRGLFGDWDEAVVALYTPLIWVPINIPAFRLPLDAWIAFWDYLL